MPAKRVTAAKKTYRVLKSFSYPKALAVRERGLSHTPKAEVGEWVQHEAGDLITKPPADVLKEMLRRDAMEPITKKGATDGA